MKKKRLIIIQKRIPNVGKYQVQHVFIFPPRKQIILDVNDYRNRYTYWHLTMNLMLTLLSAIQQYPLPQYLRLRYESYLLRFCNLLAATNNFPASLVDAIKPEANYRPHPLTLLVPFLESFISSYGPCLIVFFQIFLFIQINNIFTVKINKIFFDLTTNSLWRRNPLALVGLA